MEQGRVAGLWRTVATPRRCLDIQVPGDRGEGQVWEMEAVNVTAL